MSAQVQVSASQAQTTNIANTTPDVNRLSANFPSSIWADHFLSNASVRTNTKMEQRVQELKTEVKRKIMAPVQNVSQKLDLIDDIQRLGVSYHFPNEIDEILQQIHKNYYEVCDDGDLYTVALRFRLLRQQGYNIPCGIFNKFKGNDEKFKESLINDVVGLLSLYEATHFMIHGEDILEEALTFTTTHLESASNRLSPPLSKQVSHALYQSLRKGMPRIEARYYLSLYQERDSHDETLLTFAKLDFNLLQQLHKKELVTITRWWNDLDVGNKLPFVRDRVVELYFCWPLAVYFQPEYSFGRIILSKVTAVASIIDDIYDVYGTPEDLELFTDAVERWDISAMDQLPEYMKVCYQTLLDVYSEIEEKLSNEGKLYRNHYAIEAMKEQVRGYFHEAKWFHKKHIPTLDEYMPISLQTAGYELLTSISFVGMGDVVTKDSFEWLLSNPQAVKAASTIARLENDIASRKLEKERGHVASVVDCYMKQYGASEEEAIIELRKQVNNAWKDINEACLQPTAVPMPLLIRILNLMRACDVVYKHGDGYTTNINVLKDSIASVLVEPVPI